MLILLTIVIMLILAYCHFRQGLFSSTCTLVNVFLAGLITFNFWEPFAGVLEGWMVRTFVQGYEDFIVLITLFGVSLLVLRGVENSINKVEVAYYPALNQLGGSVVALVTGYLLSGFLICALETLPWHQNFLGFEPYNENESGVRRLMPPDRVWLALMHRAGKTWLSRGETVPTFDAEGTFESNYMRFQRQADAPPPADPAKQ
jgi:hypothetical protein